MGYRGDWAILPATVALYGRKTVDIITAASEWASSADTILVCSKEKPNGQRRFAFISSAGDCMKQYREDIGKEFSAFHDQTGVSKGYYRIENVVVLKGGKIIKQANSIGLNVKASLSVFK